MYIKYDKDHESFLTICPVCKYTYGESTHNEHGILMPYIGDEGAFYEHLAKNHFERESSAGDVRTYTLYVCPKCGTAGIKVRIYE